MHPYRMQTLIKQRGKDKIANVAQRNSVYQTIHALLRVGLIAVRETTRDEHRPERTIYEATEAGRQALRAWIRQGLVSVAREFPEFPAVLSLLDPTLRPLELAALLATRIEALEARLAEFGKAPAGLPRIYLLEEEYVAAVVRAERKWLASIIADLRSGALAFPSKAEMLRLAATMGGPSEAAINRLETELKRAAGENSANVAVTTRRRESQRATSKSTPAKKPKRRRLV